VNICSYYLFIAGINCFILNCFIRFVFSLQHSRYASPAAAYSPALARGFNPDLSQRLLPSSNPYGMAGAPQPKYVIQSLMLCFASKQLAFAFAYLRCLCSPVV